MNTPNPTAEQIIMIEEGRALAEDHSLAVLCVAVANKVAATGNVSDRDSAKVVAMMIALFSQQTTPVRGAVARRKGN